ncbi:MAG: hypothetical protein V4678_03095 [Patescibacteria group bacterium]
MGEALSLTDEQNLVADHTHDEHLRGVDLSRPSTAHSLGEIAFVSLSKHYGEDRDGAMVVPAAE